MVTEQEKRTGALRAPPPRNPLSRKSRFVKRGFDILLSSLGLVVAAPALAAGIAIARLDTGASGIFSQERVGRGGRLFRLYKIRTMRNVDGVSSSVTTARDPRITRFGRFLRRTKLDELPQLWNVLRGDMSFVGPRPDVRGFADRLQGADREVLLLRPGITGPASLHFRHEEDILAEQDDPETYNRDVVYPKKVEINLRYIREYSIRADLRYLLQTLFWRENG